MGNDLCQSVDIEGEYRRLSIFQGVSPENGGDIPPSSEPPTPKPINEQPVEKTEKQHQITKLNFKGHVVQCRKSHIKYQSSETGTKKPIAINGSAKVYSQRDNKLIFEGQLRNSKFNGFGKLFKEGKLIYQGQFKDNKFDGWGITSQYVGQFRQGLYDGYGIYQEFDSNDRNIVTFYYEGYFQNGSYCGSGVLLKGVKLPIALLDKIHTEDGILDFINDQIQHEMNIIKLEGSKQIYIGQFSNGFRHGFGRLLTQKMQFSGQFSHNLYHGLGTIYNRTSEGKRVSQAVFRMGKQFKD